MKHEQQPIWYKGGRDAEDWVTRFTVGDDYLWDTLLLPYDIEATRAHARGLVAAGVLHTNDFERVDHCLAELLTLVEKGSVAVTVEDEDGHTVIERFLTERLGEAGKKIHTGRSRNDQVLAALRLFLRGELRRSAGVAAEVVELLCTIAERHDTDMMPGYTHMQRAMPTTAGLWAAGFAELLSEDVGTLAEAYRRINRNPLGSAAGYGVPYLHLPREEAASELGFDGSQVNVTAVQLSRGKYEMQVVHACTQVTSTINRLASDLIQFSMAEFGFVSLPDEYCTGSSIMPQKRNPDVLELARAAYHRLVAEMNLLATLPANLPSGYHRDLQLTKASVMRAVTTTADVLQAIRNVLAGISFDTQRMRESVSPEMFATAEALKLVTEGVPFREAYQQAAKTRGSGFETPSNLAELYLLDGYPGRSDLKHVRTQLETSMAMFE
ncbi:MAG: argininosuccinate lyase [Rhodothermia bacterium]|nr:argininosuccinate lyase [Rhodothermia bacterium]